MKTFLTSDPETGIPMVVGEDEKPVNLGTNFLTSDKKGNPKIVSNGKTIDKSNMLTADSDGRLHVVEPSKDQTEIKKLTSDLQKLGSSLDRSKKREKKLKDQLKKQNESKPVQKQKHDDNKSDN